MSWPGVYVSEEWHCVVCGVDRMELAWDAITHRACHCCVCLTPYYLNGDREQGYSADCVFKPEYLEAFKKIWTEHQIRGDKVSEYMWNKYLSREEVSA